MKQELIMTKCGNKNALKHGAFSDMVILPEEDPNELKELLAALIDEWDPQGPTEIDKVESIARGMWRKRRFSRYVRKTFGESVRLAEAFVRRDRAAHDQLVSVLEDVEAGVLTEDSLSNKLSRRDLADAIIRKNPRNKYASDAAWRDAVGNVVAGLLDHIMMVRDGTTTICYELGVDRVADWEQSFEERIDAKIARDIKELGQIKAMKAIGIGKLRPSAAPVPLKQIESPTIQLLEGS
jgi:hypothetical protein